MWSMRLLRLIKHTFNSWCHSRQIGIHAYNSHDHCIPNDEVRTVCNCSLRPLHQVQAMRQHAHRLSQDIRKSNKHWFVFYPYTILFPLFTYNILTSGYLETCKTPCTCPNRRDHETRLPLDSTIVSLLLPLLVMFQTTLNTWRCVAHMDAWIFTSWWSRFQHVFLIPE